MRGNNVKESDILKECTSAKDLEENKRLKEALRKCHPYEWIVEEHDSKCQFCRNWWSEGHKEDCEYVRLTQEK